MPEDKASIKEKTLSMAKERGADKSTCPSEIARALFPNDWRKHMDDVRDVAIAMHKSGQVVITQKGKPIDVDHIKGPIRIKIID